MTTDPRHVRTERLDLRVVTAADVDELYRLSSDPRLWQHFPAGRHTNREHTEQQVANFVAAWARDGLGYWVAREAGTVVGVGGCMLRPGVAWNVYYRFAPAVHGKGYASEVGRAGIEQAHLIGPELPVIASLFAHNVASRSVAERIGLTLVWEGPDPSMPDGVRLLFADRVLDAAALAALTAS